MNGMSSPRAPRRAHRWLPAVLLVLAAHGCVSEGELRPDSEPIDLGVAPPGSVLEGRLTVINAADGPATVTELIWTEDRAGAFFFPDERKSLSQTIIRCCRGRSDVASHLRPAMTPPQASPNI